MMYTKNSRVFVFSEVFFAQITQNNDQAECSVCVSSHLTSAAT